MEFLSIAENLLTGALKIKTNKQKHLFLQTLLPTIFFWGGGGGINKHEFLLKFCYSILNLDQYFFLALLCPLLVCLSDFIRETSVTET